MIALYLFISITIIGGWMVNYLIYTSTSIKNKILKTILFLLLIVPFSGLPFLLLFDAMPLIFEEIKPAILNLWNSRPWK